MSAPGPDPLIRQADLLAGLIRDEDTLIARMLRQYSRVYQRITGDWLELLDELSAAVAGGDAALINLLTFQSQRLADLRTQTARQIDTWARSAEHQIAVEQGRALSAGLADAREVTTLSMELTAPGVAVHWARLPVSTLENLVGKFSNGTPLSNLFGTMGAQAASQAQDILFETVATGMHPQVAARAMRDALGIPGQRATTIARTEILGSYRRSTLEAFQANRDVIKAWRWNAHLHNSCPSCTALHGSVHPLWELMREHVNGRCAMSPITIRFEDIGLKDRGKFNRPKLDIEKPGPSWFDQLSDAEKLARLGPGKFALLKSGAIDLEDLVFEDVNPVWGLQYREASISQALFHHEFRPHPFDYQIP